MAPHPSLLASPTHHSIWVATARMPAGRALSDNIHADVCIVGGGIARLTTAYLLTKHGKSVVIVDDGPLAGGITQMTTAHLSSAIDDRFVNIERWHGEDGARRAAESHAAAIDCIESIAQELRSNCDFRRVDGYLFRTPDDDAESDVLDRELAAAVQAGVNAETVARAPIDSFHTGPAIRFPNQARVHPLKYLASIAGAIERGGGRLFVDSHVDHVEGGSPARINVGEFTITSNHVVVATNSPINDLVALHTKQAPYMTYVIGARVKHGSVTDALFILGHASRVSLRSPPAP